MKNNTKLALSVELNEHQFITEPFNGELTFNESCLISMGMDCLKLNQKAAPVNKETLFKETRRALKKYDDSHTAAIALTSVLALISSTDCPMSEVKSHLVKVIKEIDETNYG